MKTAVKELLELIPEASDIMEFISENQADEKMLDMWLWERMFNRKDWVELEKKQIVDAYLSATGYSGNCESNIMRMLDKRFLEQAEQYYNETTN